MLVLKNGAAVWHLGSSSSNPEVPGTICCSPCRVRTPAQATPLCRSAAPWSTSPQHSPPTGPRSSPPPVSAVCADVTPSGSRVDAVCGFPTDLPSPPEATWPLDPLFTPLQRHCSINVSVFLDKQAGPTLWVVEGDLPFVEVQLVRPPPQPATGGMVLSPLNSCATMGKIGQMRVELVKYGHPSSSFGYRNLHYSLMLFLMTHMLRQPEGHWDRASL